jgi:hypothetical protein
MTKRLMIMPMLLALIIVGCVPGNNSSVPKKDSPTKNANEATPTNISTRQIACLGALPSNSQWNANKSTYTQTQNGVNSEWLPASVVATYNTNGNNECEFRCNSNFIWNSANAQCVSNAVVTRQISCGGTLPANASWNAGKNSFTQIQNGAIWTPTSLSASYSANGTNECQYTCKTNYIYAASSNSCVPNTMSLKCNGTPDATWSYFSGDETFLQTWNGSSYVPSQNDAVYSSTNTSNSCEFTCKTNYVWSNTSKKCVANSQQFSCSGALPANANYFTGKNTFTQTWNGSSWVPASLNSTYASVGNGECLFSCGNEFNYVSTNNTCERKVVVQPPTEDNTKLSIPANAVLVPYSMRATLQAELDKHKIIRLEVGNYAYPNANSGSQHTWGQKYPNLKITSGQQIYGLPGTSTTPMIIEPGSTGIFIRGIGAERIIFPASNLVTKGNTFQKLRYTGLSCAGCTLEDNAFFDLSWTGFDFDFTSGGYMRNNRFTRTLMQGGKLQMKIWGHPSRTSYGNVFLFVNFLTPENATDIRNLDDFTIIGFDAESYSPGYAFIRTQEMGSLRLLGAEGGNAYNPNPNGEVVDASVNSGVLDTNADEVVYLDVHTSAFGKPHIILREKNKMFFDINSSQNWLFKDLAPSATRFRIYPNLESFHTPSLDKILLVNNAPVKQELSQAQKDLIPKFLYDDVSGEKQIPWPKPVFQTVPDPLGSNWRQVAASCVDVSDQLQKRLDAEIIMKLDPGTYCLSKPLKIQINGGIIGSGMHKTVLLAKNQNTDILAPGNWGKSFFGPLTLIDITLQGGRSGLRVDDTYLAEGGGGLLNGVNFGYVTFREFSSAALYFTGIFGVDNNFFDNLYFVNNKYGFYTISKQLPDSATQNERVSVSTYVDKVVFHQNQFINNEIGIKVGGFRANNLILFSECLFKDNTTYASEISNASRLTYTSSEFINNAGSPSLYGNASVYILNSHFVGGPLSKTMIGGDRHNWQIVEGSTFERGSADINARVFTDGLVMPCNGCHPTSRLINAPGFVGFYNNAVIDIPMGGPVEYVGMNSSMPLNPELNKKLVVITGKTKSGGISKTIVYDSDVPNPSPRILTTREK